MYNDPEIGIRWPIEPGQEPVLYVSTKYPVASPCTVGVMTFNPSMSQVSTVIFPMFMVLLLPIPSYSQPFCNFLHIFAVIGLPKRLRQLKKLFFADTTYGKWHGVVLSAENKKQFFIPKNFAHGFFVLSGNAAPGAHFSPKKTGYPGQKPVRSPLPYNRYNCRRVNVQ